MKDLTWVTERIHIASHPQEGTSEPEPLCAVLTHLRQAEVTSDKTAVTCDACKALDAAMERGGGSLLVRMGAGRRQVVRIGVKVSSPTLAALADVEDLDDARPLGYTVDEGNELLFLMIGCLEEETPKRVGDLTASANLPVKWAGEW